MSTNAAHTPPAPGRAPARVLTGAGSLQMLSDTALARLVSAGNQRAFEVVYERYRDDLYRYSLSILRHPQDGEEALQQAMLNAYMTSARSSCPPPSSRSPAA